MTPGFQDAVLGGTRAAAPFALRMPRDVGAFAAGTRLGARSGSSVDFRDYRTYMPGDDLRWIDWNVYARTDQLTVKLHHEEVSPHLDLLLDASRSMDLPETPKGAAAVALAAALATAATQTGCTTVVHVLGNRTVPLAAANTPPRAWPPFALEATRTPAEALRLEPPRLRRNSIRILLSDLMWPGDPTPLLRRIADRAADVVVLRLLAAEETQPPPLGNTRLHDAERETTLDLHLDAESSGRYREALQRHTRQWQDACRTCAARFVPLVAEEILPRFNLAPLLQHHVLVPADRAAGGP